MKQNTEEPGYSWNQDTVKQNTGEPGYNETEYRGNRIQRNQDTVETGNKSIRMKKKPGKPRLQKQK